MRWCSTCSSGTGTPQTRRSSCYKRWQRNQIHTLRLAEPHLHICRIQRRFRVGPSRYSRPMTTQTLSANHRQRRRKVGVSYQHARPHQRQRGNLAPKRYYLKPGVPDSHASAAYSGTSPYSSHSTSNHGLGNSHVDTAARWPRAQMV